MRPDHDARVHICLNLKNEAREAIVLWFNGIACVGLPFQGWA